MKIIQEKDQQPVLPEREGYVAVEKTVNAVSLNIVTLLMGLPLMAVAAISHFLLWKEVIMEQFTSLRFWLVLAVGMLVSCFLLIFLFELFHGIAWCAMSGLPMNRMRFGMAGGGLLFQCHIDGELLTKREYVRGLIIPDLIFAAVLLVVGLCLNFFLATFLGAIVLMCTLGDIMIANKVRDERDDTPVYIHPDQAGVYAYHKETE